MPKSSSDYLKALRESNYLLFLQWPAFIAEHYAKQDNSLEPVGADHMAALLVFEWINHGYNEDDAKALALLFKMSELKPNLFFADINYALITLYSALIQCMAYHSLNVHLKLVSTVPKNIKEVVAFMADNSVERVVFQQCLDKQQELFSTSLKTCDLKELEKLMQRIFPILKLRRDTVDYVDALKSNNSAKQTNSDDNLDASRLSVVLRLLQYLNEQVELTDKVEQQLSEYAATIRELSPKAFEEPFLVKISPPGLVDHTWRFIAKIGYFFNSTRAPDEAESLPESSVNYSQASK